MNNSVQIFRRLLTLRSCNRIITSGYCDDRKVHEKSDGNETDSLGSSVHPQSQIEKNTENFRQKASSSAIQKEENFNKTNKNLSGNNSSLDSSSQKEISFKTVSIEEQKNTSQLHDQDDNVTNTTSTNLNEMKKLKDEKEEGGFFTAYKIQEQLGKQEIGKTKLPPQETFASMLRKSAFIDLGDPVGKVVVGEIYLVVENDLYIDFGWKFHTVCAKPKKNPHEYVPGVKVLLKIKDLELSAKFLGSKEYISLLEADCDLLGIYHARDSKHESHKQKSEIY